MFARAASGSATIRLTYECSEVWQQWPQADEKVGSLDVTKPSYHPREDFLVSVECAFLHKAGVEVIPLQRLQNWKVRCHDTAPYKKNGAVSPL